jgi:hypothetical protein
MSGETVEIDLEQYAPARQVLLHGKVTVCEKDYCDVKKQWIYHVENEWGYKCYFYEDELEKVY